MSAAALTDFDAALASRGDSGLAGLAVAPQVQLVHLAPLDDTRHALLLQALPESERQQAARLRQPADRLRYVAAHAALRLQLSRWLGLHPAGVALVRGPHGKPSLAHRRSDAASPALHFNLSHAGDWVALAFAGQPVGIDIEGPVHATAALAAACCTPAEARALASSPQPDLAFQQVWTAKEAVLKAHGAGLSLPMDRFGLAAAGADGWQRVDAEPGSALDTAGEFRVRTWPVDARHTVSLALSAPARRRSWALADTGGCAAQAAAPFGPPSLFPSSNGPAIGLVHMTCADLLPALQPWSVFP